MHGSNHHHPCKIRSNSSSKYLDQGHLQRLERKKFYQFPVDHKKGNLVDMGHPNLSTIKLKS